MQAGTYVDPADHYEAAAEWCARKGVSGDPMILRALAWVPEQTMEDIEANPHEFRRRVSEYAYGLAMSA
jgi:hypothetical protein